MKLESIARTWQEGVSHDKTEVSRNRYNNGQCSHVPHYLMALHCWPIRECSRLYLRINQFCDEWEDEAKICSQTIGDIIRHHEAECEVNMGQVMSSPRLAQSQAQTSYLRLHVRQGGSPGSHLSYPIDMM